MLEILHVEIYQYLPENEFAFSSADQPNWARRVEALGVGPRAIPFRELTADLLADAIRQATSDPAMRQRAFALGEQIRSEDGAGTTVNMFMSFVRRGT